MLESPSFEPASQPLAALRTQRSSELVAQHTSQNKPLHLTFGMEFEFMLFVDLQATNGQWNERSAPEPKVLESLRRPFRTFCSRRGCHVLHDYELPVTTPGDYRGWNVVPDVSVGSTHGEQREASRRKCDKWAGYGFEVRTPVLSFDQDTSLHQGTLENHRPVFEPRWEIRTAIRRLREDFDSPSHPEFRLQTNSSCGLHVHIGNRSDGFSLQTIKNVVSFSTAFERVIDGVHEVDRIGGSKLSQQFIRKSDAWGEISKSPEYCVPWSFHLSALAYMFRQNTQYPHLPPSQPENIAEAMNVPAWIQRIQSVDDVQTLHEFQCTHARSTAVSINNFEVGPWRDDPSFRRDSKKTFEFRQAGGTKGFREAIHWAECVGKIVKFCDSTSPKDLGELINRRFAHTTNTSCSLLTDNFRPMIEYIEATKWHRNASANIRRRVMEKLLLGGYGQFPAAALHGVVSEQHIERLAIGWRNRNMSLNIVTQVTPSLPPAQPLPGTEELAALRSARTKSRERRQTEYGRKTKT